MLVLSKCFIFKLVSDIAIFVLKRDVKLQLTNFIFKHYKDEISERQILVEDISNTY